MDDLDPTVAERIFGEYPQLLDQWRQKVAVYAKENRRYELLRAYEPLYLEAVVRQYRWLAEGPGDSPDPKLVRRCEEIVASHAGVQKERAEALTDPWWRAAAVAVGGKMIAEFYDPEYLEGLVERRRRTDNPFSEESLTLDRLATAIERGGTVTLTEIESGQVVDSWHLPGDPKRASRGEN
jgi:hypothetical protein